MYYYRTWYPINFYRSLEITILVISHFENLLNYFVIRRQILSIFCRQNKLGKNNAYSWDFFCYHYFFCWINLVLGILSEPKKRRPNHYENYKNLNSSHIYNPKIEIELRPNRKPNGYPNILNTGKLPNNTFLRNLPGPLVLQLQQRFC